MRAGARTRGCASPGGWVTNASLLSVGKYRKTEALVCCWALAVASAGCSRSSSTGAAGSSTASTVAAPVASAQASAPSPSASAAPRAPQEVADAGPPRRQASGEGITITETADGRVIVKTTSLWNEPIDTTYASCEYYRGAVPVLERQLSKERAKLLTRVCAKSP